MVNWFNIILNDIKELILFPRQFWKEKKSEPAVNITLWSNYFIPFLILAGIAVFLGELLNGSHMYIIFPLLKALRKIVLVLCMYFLSYKYVTLVMVMMGQKKDTNTAHKLTVFSLMPFILISVITGLFPFLYVLNVLGLYSFYIFMTGIKELTDFSDKKYNKYIFAAMAVLLVSFVILSVLLSKLLTLL
jgi:hypothetical protein